MTAGGRYVLGATLVAVVAAGLTQLVAAGTRPGVWAAVLTGIVVQGPLGWWLVRAAGTERFLLAWAVGMGARLALLAVAGLVIVPRLGFDMAATLLALVGVLISFVMVEGIAVWPRKRETKTA